MKLITVPKDWADGIARRVVSGISFLPLLCTLLVLMKLTGFIHCSWWWVLAPLWAPAAFVGAMVSLLLPAYLLRRQG